MQICVRGGIGNIFKTMIDGYKDDQMEIHFIRKEKITSVFDVSTSLNQNEALRYFSRVIKKHPYGVALYYIIEAY